MGITLGDCEWEILAQQVLRVVIGLRSSLWAYEAQPAHFENIWINFQKLAK